MNRDIDRGPMPEGGNWAGIWFTNWGEMSLSLTGSSVVGDFCQEDRNRYGRLEGTASGNVMTFHWITNDVSMSGANRETEGSGIVQFSFVTSGENQTAHMEGTWGYESANADGGIIRGDRSPRRSDNYLRGTYTLNCPIRQSAEGAAPLSNEEVGDNPSDGEEESEGLEEEGEEEDDDSVIEEM